MKFTPDDGEIQSEVERGPRFVDNDCPACVKEKHGVCKFHEKFFYPQLTQPKWVRLIGKQEQIKPKPETSPEAERVIRRKERKRSKRAKEKCGVNGLLAAIRSAA